MHFNERFAEAIKTTGLALENTSGTPSGWVAVRDFDRIAFSVVSDTAALAITLEQAQDCSGTNAKALNIDLAADAAGAAVVGEDSATEDTIDGVLTVEALVEQMDLNGGFTHVQCAIAAGAANVAIVVHGCGVRVRPAFKHA